ncbi:hypothetical protein MNBD_NITROSPINAE04-1272 [hydrothermal vent metagenome]|uniref:Peptidase M43 pregnancy-associated plasma-A domain-containing protein n=1 Tax=hydrothermal vent metagenome TaxID=652676 RepID=A0A3B1B965_9ZZZZ
MPTYKFLLSIFDRKHVNKYFIAALALLAGMSIAGCSEDGGTSSTSLEKVDSLTLPTGTVTNPFRVSVPSDASSLTIIADGGDASDIDIYSITDPTGAEMVVWNSSNDLVGRNSTENFGQSALSFTIPHSSDYAFNSGEWSFEIANVGSTFVSEGSKEVSIYTIIKTGLGSKLDVNVWIVAIQDYTGTDDKNLAVIIDEFKRIMENAGVTIGNVNIRELTGSQAELLTFPDMSTDSNVNKQPDDLDDLFRLSSQTGNDYLNLFFVTSMGSGLLGRAGGIPGIPLLQGTAHSGVVVSTMGGFTQMPPAQLLVQGATIAHEVGHYLGLYHPTERSGKTFDPISDTPECRAETYDTDGDGVVTSNECKNLDGPNLMFWSSASYVQDTFSSMQEDAIKRHPSVK